jgi:hypothetical protein
MHALIQSPKSIWKFEVNRQSKKIPDNPTQPSNVFFFIGLAYQGKDIVFRFIIEYNSLMDFGLYIIGLFIFLWGFLKDDILACVETWD